MQILGWHSSACCGLALCMFRPAGTCKLHTLSLVTPSFQPSSHKPAGPRSCAIFERPSPSLAPVHVPLLLVPLPFFLFPSIMALVPPWVRIYRIQRDIPMPLVTSGVEKGNLRQLALARMAALGLRCRCEGVFVHG